MLISVFITLRTQRHIPSGRFLDSFPTWKLYPKLVAETAFESVALGYEPNKLPHTLLCYENILEGASCLPLS